MSGYLLMPGTDNNFLSTPDAPVLDVAGDLDIEFSGYTNDDSLLQMFIDHHDGNGYAFYINTANGFTLALSGGRSAAIAHGGLTAGQGFTARATFVSATGVVEMSLNGSSLGTTSVASGAIAAPAVTAAICGNNTGGQALSGRFDYLWVKSGIGGTTVLDADVRNLTAAEVAAKEFTEDSSNAATVTINGTGWSYVRKSGLKVAGPGQLLQTGG